MVPERGDRYKTTAGIRYIIKQYHRKAGIDDKYSLHSYRHYFAVNLLRGDHPTDLVTVSKLLNHSSTELTARVYAQSSKEDVERAIDSL